MSIGDSLGYLAFGNPISQAVINTAAGLAKSTGLVSKQQGAVTKTTKETAEMITKALPLWRIAGKNYNFIRLAGLCGASAVVLGAIGSHRLKSTPDKPDPKSVFEIANRFHFIHSIALMTMPLCKRPYLTGTLMITGTLLFSGALYYHAFTGEKKFSRLAPIGGFCLIISWLSLVF